MVQTRPGGGVATQARTHAFVHNSARTIPASVHSQEICLDNSTFSSLSLAWLTSVSSTYSIKQDFSEKVTFIPAWCPLSPPPSASQLSQWQLVFFCVCESRLKFTFSCHGKLWTVVGTNKSASKTTVITVASFYPLNSVWSQYSGLKYYLHRVHSLRGSHESILNR